MVARGKMRTSRQAWLILLASILFLAGLTGTVMATPAGGESTHESGSAAVEHGEGAAESHGGNGDAHHDEGAMLDLLARFINFALLVIILAVVLKKSNALGFFSDRVTEIKERMEQLQREKEEAEARYKEVQRKLTDFEAEKKAILDAARKDGETERVKILAEAEKRVEQMLGQVELTIQQEVLEAKGRLKREVADLAAEKAREIIARELNEEDQDRLVNEFIERVGKVH